MILATKLRQYIAESGYTIYQVAKISGVDRTSIQKTLSGQRLMSEKSMHKVLKCLHLTAYEKESLLKYYEMNKVGDNVYYQREYIKQIIENIPRVRQAEGQGINVLRDVKVTLDKTEDQQLVCGEYAVAGLLRAYLEEELCNEEHPALSVFLPPREDLLNSIIPLFSLNGQPLFQRLTVIQLIRFAKNMNEAENERYNLKLLNMILPYSLAAGAGYHVYYYYSGFSPADDDGLLFPYYIIYKDKVVLISPKIDAAVVCRSPEIMDYCRNEFRDKILKGSARLLETYRETEDVVRHFWRADQKAERIFRLEFQPCFAAFGNEELAEAVLRRGLPGREELMALVLERITQLRQMEKPCSYFTERGLRMFARDGIATAFPAKYVRPFTVQERIWLLEQLKEAVSEETHVIRVINPAMFKIPDYLSISVSEGCGMNLSIMDEEIGFKYIYIQEATLGQSFEDFMINLASSALVYTKEKTLDIIEDYLANLRGEGKSV